MVILRHGIAGVRRMALERFAARASRAAGVRGEVDILVSDDAELRRLNRRFRHQDKPTDVLSFPGLDGGSAGDVAISVATATRNAKRLGHSTADELKVLLLHGLLHLAGYDHEHDHGEMAGKEQRLRRQLGLPVSLIERNHGGGRRRRK